MNCLDARRRLLTEPGSQDPALGRHLAACDACAAQATRSARLEHIVRDAARIPVPEGLASRVLLRQEFDHQAIEQRPARARARPASAAAAALLLAAALTRMSRPSSASRGT